MSQKKENCNYLKVYKAFHTDCHKESIALKLLVKDLDM